MDHYQTLGVAKNATPDEIKKAYRKLASQHHPDKGGDTAMFQKIEEAYRILSDPQKRQEYDSPNPFSGRNGFPEGFGSMFTDNMDPRDIFSHIFGQNHSPFGQRAGQQVFRTQVSITLEDAYYGKSQVLRIQTPTGSNMINIDIPRGVKEHSQMKYDHVIPNATLLVEFRITPSLKFERKGNDLYCNQPISVLDLIVGTKIDFTTLSGKTFEVTVPAKTQPYMQLKIAGQGMPLLGTNLYGDQILLLKPFIPDNINDDITQSILRSKSN